MVSIRLFAVTLCALTVAGCQPLTGTKGVAPSTAEEKAVAKHILATAHDPGSVEFVKWGPHQSMAGGGAGAGPQSNFTHGMRVVYRGKNALGAMQLQDMLYLIDKTGAVHSGWMNSGGDNWNQTKKGDPSAGFGWGPGVGGGPGLGSGLVPGDGTGKTDTPK